MGAYQAGSSGSQITLTVDIQTEGLAASKAVLKSPNHAIPLKVVAVSEDATGDIRLKEIGSAAEVRDQKLSIFTKVDFFGDKAQRKAQYEALAYLYTLQGGDDGLKNFADPMKSTDSNYYNASVHMLISLS